MRLETDEVYATLFTDENDIVYISDSGEDIQQVPTNFTTSIPLAEILANLAEQIDRSKTSLFNISRNHLFDGVKRGLKRKSFHPKNKISVKFTDDDGSPEGAVDAGGPMRELLTLTVKYITNSELFDGELNQKYISCNNPVKADLTALQNAPIDEANQVLTEKLENITEIAGTWRIMRTEIDKAAVIGSTVKWYLYGRNREALYQFTDGLSTLGVLEAMKQYPTSFKPVFCEPAPLTTDMFLSDVTRSVEGSNLFNAESLILSHWADFLQDVQDQEINNLTLAEVLMFATGCTELIHGLSPRIAFLHGSEGQCKFPKANTCGGVLHLPVIHKTYDEFKHAMAFAITNSKGFGYA
ncbi:G2/M phase-specific E3 ubiquitin-protein ligase-like [Ptychodera flava]|uniref:G2/M phase-specific E3 ubiquitin-protein ligase-like n=1 Tax=Ptychodera flava TaxID=63121 RepID=UPI003969F8CD